MSKVKGKYTSDLLGGLRAHLQGLQGYDIMTLELLQNADDSKATNVVFDIQDDGLKVWNNGVFSYCGDLENECALFKEKGKTCDFHNLIRFQSGGKRGDSENIGRFGIGFSSTYQITDYPEVTSSNIKLQLCPDDGSWEKEELLNTKGTTFFLPWAVDADSEVRRELNASPITNDLIEKVCLDCKNVLKDSLFFLKNIQHAEVKRNGKPLLAVELERSDDRKDLIVSFQPENNSEQLLILESNIEQYKKDKAFEKYPQLKQLNRKDNISIAIRIDGSEFTNGLLYAFLPTRQTTGLPLHINADFFPESNRKSLVFDGGGHEKYWNELLIETAAKVVSENLELIRDEIKYTQLWSLLDKARELTNNNIQKISHPNCFSLFWSYIKVKVEVEGDIKICYSSQGQYEQTKDLFSGKKEWKDEEIKVFNQIGGKLAHKDLTPYRNTLQALGVKDLKIKNFVSILEKTDSLLIEGSLIDDNKLSSFYRPIWSITNSLLDRDYSNEEVICNLKGIPFVVDTTLKVRTIERLYTSILPITNIELAKAFIFLKFAHDDSHEYSFFSRLIDCFELGDIVKEIFKQIESLNKSPKDFLPSSQSRLYSLYSLISKLDSKEYKGNDGVYEELKDLPIWKTDRDFSTLNESLLPGDFDDPTGEAKLLNRLYLSPTAEEFIIKKLKVRRQTIKEYVRVVLPKVFDEEGPNNVKTYQNLIKIFADHNSLIDDDEIVSLLKGTPLIPNIKNGWSTPEDIYFKTKDLSSLLGDTPELWIDEKILPNENSVHVFIKSIGVSKEPKLEHIIDRIYALSSDCNPTNEVKKLSENAFYKLCEIYDGYGDKQYSATKLLNKLINSESLPIIGDNDKWYRPEEIYAPCNYQAFESQAKILSFLDIKKLSNALLEDLYITTEPRVDDIIEHLLHCINNKKSAHRFVYQELNKKAKNKNNQYHFDRLKDKKCIYISEEIGYVRPNQVFYATQKLGKYAFNIPDTLNQFKSLFDLIGVKDTPDIKDYVDIVEDIKEEYFPTFILESSKDIKIYKVCVKQINNLDEKTPEDRNITVKLTEFQSILNVNNRLCYPDEVLIDDSEWYKSYFNEDEFDWLTKIDERSQELFLNLGTKKLSEATILELDYKEGEENHEIEILNIVKERSDLYARVLHLQNADFLLDFRRHIEELNIISVDALMVKAIINSGDLSISSEPRSVSSFFDQQKNELYIIRPISDDNIDIFKPLLHTLLPSYNDSDILLICDSFSHLSKSSLKEGVNRLDRLGYPDFNQVISDDDGVDISSKALEGLGSGESEAPPEEKNNVLANEKNSTKGHNKKASELNQKQSNEVRSQENNDNPLLAPENPRPNSKQVKKAKNKNQKRLVSYVELKSNQPNEEKTDNEKNLAIEVKSREWVHKYEINRGRKPIDMPQTNPGYDIESVNKDTGEIERFIEIKGSTSSWGDRGVGISRMQHSQAQELGKSFWLYVVENVYEKHAKVYAIQNPAMKINKFMFDSAWKAEAEEEVEDINSRYRVGTRINHETFGDGKIEEVIERGGAIQLIIDFDDSDKKMISLNTKVMHVLYDEDE